MKLNRWTILLNTCTYRWSCVWLFHRNGLIVLYSVLSKLGYLYLNWAFSSIDIYSLILMLYLKIGLLLLCNNFMRVFSVSWIESYILSMFLFINTKWKYPCIQFFNVGMMNTPLHLNWEVLMTSKELILVKMARS